MSHHYPAFLNLAGRRCVVVGGGAVAERKVRHLVESRATVEVIAPVVTTGLRGLAADGAISLAERAYRAGDLAGATVAFAATDNGEVNAEVVAEARQLGALANSADDAEAADFIVPAVVRRGGVTLAISTGGRSPSFARQLREELEAWLTPERVELLEVLADLRRELQATGSNPAPEIWRRAVDAEVVRTLEHGDRRAARDRLARALVPSPSAERA